jgi:Na+-driven multidrug efflux pump
MKNRLKAVLSTILFVCFLLLAITGGITYFMKIGMIGIFSRKFLHDLHVVVALVMSLCIVFHFTLNFGLFKAELKAFLKGNGRKKP